MTDTTTTSDAVVNILSTVFDKPMSSGLGKRLKKELEGMVRRNICDIESIHISVRFDESSHKHVYTLSMRHQRAHYQFLLPTDYPFHPPKLILNSRTYMSYLQISSIPFKQALGKYTSKNCFCCTSKLCHDNWSPVFLLESVFDEVAELRAICRRIAIHVILQVICRKHLIEDIDLAEWLF